VKARLARAGIGLLTAAVLTAPFAAAWHLHNGAGHVAGQRTTPPAGTTPGAVAAWRALGAALPDRAAPVILAYHDIAPGSDGRYTVDPARFDTHLTALRAAGYRALTARQFTEFVEGGPVPPRSVLLTFDDGAQGLWVHADRILARHGMHGSAFLITGRVGEHRPYYLSWAEVSRMRETGRWDFQSHSHDLHRRAAEEVSPDEARQDLERSLSAFAAHGLPRPALFSFPFSATRGFTDEVVGRLFTASLTNRSGAPRPVSRRAAAEGRFERLEVLAGTTADELVREVARRTPLPAESEPLTDPGRWRSGDRGPLGTGDLPFNAGRRPRGGDYQYAEYAPHAAADWDDYTVRADVAGLVAGGATFGLTARAGGSPVEVRISHGVARLVEDGRTTVERELAGADGHRLHLTVTGRRTTLVIDGAVTLTATAPGPVATGGIAVSASRPGSGTPWPVVTALRVGRCAGGCAGGDDEG
jgi:peptidoglycan/xylan/chitin deacetylase (PgdA/CDA1 family)